MFPGYGRFLCDSRIDHWALCLKIVPVCRAFLPLFVLTRERSKYGLPISLCPFTWPLEGVIAMTIRGWNNINERITRKRLHVWTLRVSNAKQMCLHVEMWHSQFKWIRVAAIWWRQNCRLVVRTWVTHFCGYWTLGLHFNDHEHLSFVNVAAPFAPFQKTNRW